MIKRSHILTFLAALGLILFYAAHKLYKMGWIVDDTYFMLYAIGLMVWSFRIRLQQISKFDALVGNIMMWLCVFNVWDEVFSSNPQSPWRPYIASTIVIISSLYIYHRECKKEKKSSQS